MNARIGEILLKNTSLSYIFLHYSARPIIESKCWKCQDTDAGENVIIGAKIQKFANHFDFIQKKEHICR